MDIEKMTAAKLKLSRPTEDGDGQKLEEPLDVNEDPHKVDVSGKKVDTEGVARGPTSTIHTDHDVFMDLNVSIRVLKYKR